MPSTVNRRPHTSPSFRAWTVRLCTWLNVASFKPNLRVVIVDEIHAFAGDDRGWHLLSVLERITRLAGRELQRLGLSATVGNPERLSDWLAGACAGPRAVIRPLEVGSREADVQLDFVGSLQNAAVVISRLHRGEKRLVFLDSRARAEQLAADLRQLQVTTFVTHASLGQEHRHQAEEAFASRDDCVIVATSVLELGIDVGNLDRVIQIDSPPTVSSFIQAAGLIDLWAEGYIEPIEPPPLPLHVLAQQLMALTLQESGVGRAEWLRWVQAVPGFAAIPPEQIELLVTSMLEREILWEEAGILAMGREGEETYGRRNFFELFSVFLSPPLFSILHGRHEIGYVDEMTFLGKQEGPRVLLLGGRSWQVNHIDWQRRIAYVEATDATGRTRWKGEGRGLGFRLSQAIKRILASDETSQRWSRRATERIGEIRHEFSWLEADSTVALQAGKSGAEWWTFGGNRANATLARELAQEMGTNASHDSFTVTFGSAARLQDVERAIEAIRQHDVVAMRPAVDEAAIEGLKFSACLPINLATEVLERRLQEPEATRHILLERVRFVVQ